MKMWTMAVAVGLLGSASAALGQGDRDAVTLDPAHHHVILENDHVRVFEAMAKPGDTSPMHTHHPLVLISLDKARARVATPDGNSTIFDLNPGLVVWLEGVEHSWEILSGQVHLFGVEAKSARGGAAPGPVDLGPRDAVAADPTHHHVVFENDHVRVFEAQASPGETTPMHTHPPTVIISAETGRMRMQGPDGTTTIFDLHPSQAIWIEGVEHSWELLSGRVHAFGVEVKSAR